MGKSETPSWLVMLVLCFRERKCCTWNIWRWGNTCPSLSSTLGPMNALSSASRPMREFRRQLIYWDWAAAYIMAEDFSLLFLMQRLVSDVEQVDPPESVSDSNTYGWTTPTLELATVRCRVEQFKGRTLYGNFDCWPEGTGLLECNVTERVEEKERKTEGGSVVDLKKQWITFNHTHAHSCSVLVNHLCYLLFFCAWFGSTL